MAGAGGGAGAGAAAAGGLTSVFTAAGLALTVCSDA